MKPSPRSVSLALGTALCVLAASIPAFAEGKSKLDRFLREARKDGSVQRVIIQTRPGARAALKKALQSHGDVILAEHASLDALSVRLHGEDLAALEANPGVVAVSVDAEVQAFGVKAGARPKADDSSADLLRQMLGIKGLPLDGTGINVAIVDSGIEPNRDLLPSIAGFWDFTRGGVVRRARDDYGHGTHIAGLIASNGVDSEKAFAGVAPGVRLYGFRVLDEKGRGRVSDVVKALEFIVANKKSAADDAFKIDVVNLSLGHPVYEPAASDPLVRAVESAVRAGIVVVTAAGNIGTDSEGTAGYTGVTSPGNAPSAITIGAVDTRNTLALGDDLVASFSSRGPTWFDGFAKPDLVAPGVGLTSDAPRTSSLFDAFPELKRSWKNGRATFGTLSGTSMASAVTTGVASLVLQASRITNAHGSALSPNALKAVLQYTAVPLQPGGAPDLLAQGTGELNAHGALALAASIDTSMPAGAPWLRLPLEPQNSINGAVYSWSRALIWDDNIVWGTDALSFNSPQWGDEIVWGTALAGDDNIVWGTAAEVDNIVWGTAATWASSLVWSNRVIGLLADGADNIVWGTADGLTDENIVWGTFDGDNIVWGTWDGDNIVWGTSGDDNIVWGTFEHGDNIVWGTVRRSADEIVWGTSVGARR